jgi:hypothetical protein
LSFGRPRGQRHDGGAAHREDERTVPARHAGAGVQAVAGVPRAGRRRRIPLDTRTASLPAALRESVCRAKSVSSSSR